ncbi:MAG: ATP-binding cassette domain-containing protein [Phycisphaerae bacterium]|nr:ATP-binding cassette domain-containing protein [Phycisphaerae bacterium]
MVADSLPVLQTVGLTKVFRDFWWRARVEAVKDLNLEIHRGEVFGLLGPNGSGKSTAIKLILGLLYPNKGRIAVFGKPPTDVQTKKRIGFLPEESYLYQFLNARETLDYYGRLFQQHGSVRRERIDRLLEMVGLEHEAKRRIGEYSKGMARRIGLAQALINDPEFLILDEPTAGLDPIGTRQIKDMIRELAKMGKTILLSSHLLADVEDVCDRVTILYGGRQRKEGGIAQLLARENLTQITTEKLSEDTVKQVRQLIRRLEGKELLDVTAPSDKLEDLFLRIVREAQERNVRTSGARAAGELPAFLGTTKEPETTVIESLVEAALTRQAAPEPVETAPAADIPPKPSKEVIEQLMSKPEQPSTKPESVEPRREKPRDTAEVDREVIDGLLNKQEGDLGE